MALALLRHAADNGPCSGSQLAATVTAVIVEYVDFGRGQGAAEILKGLQAEGKIDGVIGMGGGGGTSVDTTAMRTLPIGFPKVMVSTVASGDVSGFVGTSDITMMPSVIDVAGVNRISR